MPEPSTSAETQFRWGGCVVLRALWCTDVHATEHSHPVHGCGCPAFFILRGSEAPGAGFPVLIDLSPPLHIGIHESLVLGKGWLFPVYTTVIRLAQVDFSCVVGGHM